MNRQVYLEVVSIMSGCLDKGGYGNEKLSKEIILDNKSQPWLNDGNCW